MSNNELERTYCSYAANEIEYSTDDYIADSEPYVMDALLSKLAL
jgi:hypothetical protein